MLRQKGNFLLYTMPGLQIFHLIYTVFPIYIAEKQLKIEDTALKKHTCTPVLKDVN